MKAKVTKYHLMKNCLKNETGQIDSVVTFLYCFGVIVVFFCFVLAGVKYIHYSTELNYVADNTVKDAMQMNGGLTPELETFVQDELRRKGFDLNKVRITGTQKGEVNFGEQMEATLRYEYSLPYPTTLLGNPNSINTPIIAPVYPISLEVVR
ncbi:hypothetical protein NSQ59_27310 [Margalitia sp. FSL K6-0131]|uniref:hypothetical protein n=1 Tax=Margalitia sp. FSL K6-0131 TaxID=2954604 RepID=UPI0030FBFB51